MFLYLAYQNPHRPQEVPLEYESGYEFINNTQRRSLAGEIMRNHLLDSMKAWDYEATLL